jgi:hypothetical protein
MNYSARKSWLVEERRTTKMDKKQQKPAKKQAASSSSKPKSKGTKVMVKKKNMPTSVNEYCCWYI